jgi:ADP-heptose:LPS heptosyltransferase
MYRTWDVSECLVVRRFQGEPLPEKAKIAVISNDAIGNFVAATPLLQLLRANFPGSFLGYFAGTRVAEFCDASALFDHWQPIHGVAPSELVLALESQAGTYHLVINMEQSALAKFVASALAAHDGFVCGPCLDQEGRKDLGYASDARGDLWRDKEWVSPELCQKYPFLQSGFICEIFARLAYLSGDVPGYCVPTQPLNAAVPNVLVAPSASLPEKLWPAEKWSAALTFLADQGLTCGILGAPPAVQAQYWKGQNLESDLIEAGLAQDLRGKLTLPQVASAVDACRAVLTLDNGIMHLAAAGSKPVVALFRHGIHRLWAPPAPNLIAIVSEPEGTVGEIAVQPVIDALASALGITCPK